MSQPFQLFRSLRIAVIAAALAFASPGTGRAAELTDEQAGMIESFFNAIRDWFNSQNQDPPPSNTPAPSPSPPPSISDTPEPSKLANLIASDAGGHPDQYSRYAEKLAGTLSKLTPSQRARVLRN